MQCPKCEENKLFPGYLEDSFRAHACSNCGGNWVLIENYVAWKERNPEYVFTQDSVFEVEETKKALICPVSGKVMHKYKISNDSSHKLDYSPEVGGVWLDKGEWGYLKEKNLAGSLNNVFTSHWQKTIRDKNAELTFADIYREKFGEESYAKVKSIREWVNNHQCKIDIRAYIMAEDPYSVDK